MAISECYNRLTRGVAGTVFVKNRNKNYVPRKPLEISLSEVHEKLAKILRADPAVLLDLEKQMEKVSGQTGVLEQIVEENKKIVDQNLAELGLTPESSAEEVYQSLTDRLKKTDENLNNFLDHPDPTKMSNVCGKLCETALELNRPKPGLFIKKEKAVEMLEKFPPKNLLDFFGYDNVEDLINRQGFAPVFSALRFAQDKNWMSDFFDQAYDTLNPDDFEERGVELIVLEPEWLNVAGQFLEKKYHNVSHLKELGIIFVIPLQIDTPGETLRLFSLILHYLNEVPFYSKLFWDFSGDADFSYKLKSLLRGDVSERPRTDNHIRIVQRYLAKDDPNDFRLLEPHVNPEAEHWYKAEGDLGKLSQIPEFAAYQASDFAGDFFKTKDGQEALISFDLIDLVMSLVKKGEIKYLYHQQEALWNKIFIEYLGREKIEQLVEKGIIDGFIKL